MISKLRSKYFENKKRGCYWKLNTSFFLFFLENKEYKDQIFGIIKKITIRRKHLYKKMEIFERGG